MLFSPQKTHGVLAMCEKKSEAKEKSVKTRELLQILRANEEFLRSISYNKNLVTFIKELRIALQPCRDLNGEEILQILRQSLKTYGPAKGRDSTLLRETNVELLPLDKIKESISSRDLSTKDLLLIAEKNLGIPSGTLKKMKKELIKQRIIHTIENIEKLDTIKKKAAE